MHYREPNENQPIEPIIITLNGIFFILLHSLATCDFYFLPIPSHQHFCFPSMIRIRLTPFLSRNKKIWQFSCDNLNIRFKPAMITTQVYASLWKATSAGKSLNHIRIFLLA